jgi:hypothetical protein
MNAIISLGRFERIPLAIAWPAEDGNFTPWLAGAEAIKLLSEALAIELEVEAVERWVGSFRADILARTVDQLEHHGIIENQLGRTDHKHLGQILTYLAGVESAKTIIWIAETIQSDHRAAIDWLNTNTTEEYSFFAVEIELWRIEQSPPAPRFNVIASPNNWARRARNAAKLVESAEDAERFRIRLAYWASFGRFLEEKKSRFRIRRDVRDSWFYFPIGCSGFNINATLTYSRKRVGVELYISGLHAKLVFKSLLQDKEKIEREFGEPLEWCELQGKTASRISLFRQDVDPADEEQYADLHVWMLSKMEKFRAVFAERVKALSNQVAVGKTPTDSLDD